MNRAIFISLGAALAASALSGCFFGLLKVQRDPSTPPAPVVDATAKVVRSAQAPVRHTETPMAVAPASQASTLTPPLSNIVRFSVDAYQPGSSSDGLLRAHAEQLKADPSLRLLLKGHGDARGSVHYKRALAAKRAEMVAKALLNYGVAARQLTQAIGDVDNPNSPDVSRVELIYL